MSKPKNPQAFPNNQDDHLGNPVYDGMTLLDYFTGQALVGIKSNHILCEICADIEGKTIQEAVAIMAYKDAEAMLKERKRRNKN